MSMSVLGQELSQLAFSVSFPVWVEVDLVNPTMPMECVELAFFRPLHFGANSMSSYTEFGMGGELLAFFLPPLPL